MTTPSPEPARAAAEAEAHACRCVAALLARLGAPDVRPASLATRSNLVLALMPLPLVARVALVTSRTGVGLGALGREVALSRALDARGCAVTRPSATLPAGPHLEDGLVVSFWEREALVPSGSGVGEADAHGQALEAGRRLADVHAALRDTDAQTAGLGLARWGALDEARDAFARAETRGAFSRDEARVLARAWERARRVAEDGARSDTLQIVHGDAHVGNVLDTARGPVWTDWEDAFVGPVEFDLACLRSKADLFGEERPRIDAVLRGYGERAGGFDPERVRALGFVRNVQVTSWLAVLAEHDASLRVRLRARLAHLGDAS